MLSLVPQYLQSSPELAGQCAPQIPGCKWEIQPLSEKEGTGKEGVEKWADL